MKDGLVVHMVTDNFTVGGGIEHIYQVARGLPDFTFRIFGRPGEFSDKFAGLPNVETCPLGYHPSLILRQNPDIVHIHHLRPLFAFYRRFFPRQRVPVIFTAHGLHVHKYEFAPSPWNRLNFLLRFQLEKRLFARVDRVIAVSRADRDFMKTRYRLSRVSHIPNAIDSSPLAEAPALRSQLEKEFLLPAGGILFITVARFDFQKGYDVLLRAIASSGDFLRRRNARFLLVGEGATLPAMKALADRLGVTNLVRFLGRRMDAASLMKSADIFVLPSRWEGLPIAALEAGWLKIPLIASDTYGNNELVGSGGGILFANENAEELADRMRGAASGEYDLRRIADRLHQTIDRDYSMARMLSGLRKIYASRGRMTDEPAED